VPDLKAMVKWFKHLGHAALPATKAKLLRRYEATRTMTQMIALTSREMNVLYYLTVTQRRNELVLHKLVSEDINQNFCVSCMH